ncbi:adenylate/guanylate cyclase domain-containing protein [bacterium]|nr:adenylate/guanylate cyclase domain-containing protein [bacterium]
MKWLYSGYAVVLSIVLLLALRVADPTALQSFRSQIFDSYQQLDTIVDSNDVAIINIGEKSLQALGQYPFPRTTYAQLIYDIRQKNQGILGFTIMFPEADRFGGDEVFASWIKDNGIVLSQTPSSKGVKSTGPHIGTGTIGPLPAQDFVLTWPNLVTNMSQLETMAFGIGVNASAPQPDNQTRTYPLTIGVEGKLYPSFAIEMLRVNTGKPSYIIKTTEVGISEIAVPPYEPVVTQPDGTSYIRFNNKFQEVEYTNADSLPNMGGKFVILGVTAEGIANPVPTPIGLLYPQHVQAHMLQNLISGTNITRSQLSAVTELLCALLSMILIALAIYKLPVWAGLVTTVTLISGIVYYSISSYTANLILFDATFPAIASFLIFSQASFNNFWIQFKLRAEIQKQFAGYASPTVVRMLQENPELIKQGMKKEVSICFSDLRGFTPLGESFGDDVQGLTKIMNGYMDAITQPILDADGMVIKYIGDASMHIHNAPMDDPDHPASAVNTGILMLRAVEKFNDQIVKEGRPPVGMGAGINTGLGYIGEMGSTARHSYDILGDAVSTAARIESKCKEYGCLLLVGGDTYKHTKHKFFYLKVDDLAVKGKTVGIEIYTVLDVKLDKYAGARQLHEDMHMNYRKQDFDKAIKLCNQLHDAFEGKMSGYYDMWIERCEFQKTQTLPKDWDGVFIATSK